MTLHDDVEGVFPELDDIEDDDLREGVVNSWVVALEENGAPDLESYPWYGAYQAELGLEDETLVEHVRDVTAVATAIADVLLERRPDLDLDRDVVIAGALIHEISHVGEFDGYEWSEVGDLLSHPYYGIHVVRAGGLPPIFEHIVLTHTIQTDVAPATLEAKIVATSDIPAFYSILSRVVDDLREAPPISET